MTILVSKKRKTYQGLKLSRLIKRPNVHPNSGMISSSICDRNASITIHNKCLRKQNMCRINQEITNNKMTQVHRGLLRP